MRGTPNNSGGDNLQFKRQSHVQMTLCLDHGDENRGNWSLNKVPDLITHSRHFEEEGPHQKLR